MTHCYCGIIKYRNVLWIRTAFKRSLRLTKNSSVSKQMSASMLTIPISWMLVARYVVGHLTSNCTICLFLHLFFFVHIIAIMFISAVDVFMHGCDLYDYSVLDWQLCRVFWSPRFHLCSSWQRRTLHLTRRRFHVATQSSSNDLSLNFVLSQPRTLDTECAICTTTFLSLLLCFPWAKANHFLTLKCFLVNKRRIVLQTLTVH